MGEASRKKRICIGLAAHVDAGKTTLSEALLYLTGGIRSLGRVDHGSAYLDTHALERARGITIFSKQAVITTDSTVITLMDTPGHVDFSPEAERVIRMIDYAVLVISGTDGIQAHTMTLWRLIRRCKVPTFIFVNKMDIAAREREALIDEIRRRLSPNCVDFSADSDSIVENAAFTNEALFEEYSNNGTLNNKTLAEAIRREWLFPCFFGSALKLNGVDAFIKGLEAYTIEAQFKNEFAARVYKISRDAQGVRLTNMRVTGGSLTPRMAIEHTDRSGAVHSEKIAQIRLYSGEKFTQLQRAEAGDVVAVTGLSHTFQGEGLGAEQGASALITPVLSYRVVPRTGDEPEAVLKKLTLLSEEEPSLCVEWDERLNEIRARLMGEVQIEILKSLMLERFGLEIELDSGRVMYKETIEAPVVGIGHFEPLRHYAEVHLLLEPLEAGSGLVFGSLLSANALDASWQRLILTHLAEKSHLGVLTGSPITDMRISLIAGRASLTHTEGGDFRQATYRAVRQGLMKAKSVLLEPYYAFKIELPREQLGRAINDIRSFGGSFSLRDGEEVEPENAVVTGFAPVARLRGYANTLAAYTGGRGRFFAEVSHYDRCNNADEVIVERAYAPLRDVENTPDSVFCAHGAGFNVRWSEVDSYKHIDSGITPGAPADNSAEAEKMSEPRLIRQNLSIDEKELEAIMLREFGPIRRPEYGRRKADDESPEALKPIKTERRVYDKERLIVDGYNMLFQWKSLKALAEADLDAARHRLMDILANYCGYRKNEVVLVFDGYRVKGNAGERFDYHGIHVAYTRENETADALIERLTAEIGKNYAVRVASSDGLIQLASVRAGALRVTAAELEAEVESVNARLFELMERLKKETVNVKLVLSDNKNDKNEM